MKKSRLTVQLFALLLIAMAVFGSACSHHRGMQVGSHKVTIVRHGFTKSLHNDPKAATFEFDGTSLTGGSYKVSITGDKVKVNGKDYGMLRHGDSVVIGDEGLRVNSMDYGQSEKYLRANLPAPEQAAVN
jgi:hypothetical protein